MDELESRLEHQLSGLARVPLAEPAPVEDLRRRARHVRVGRALTSVAAVATAVVVIGAVVVAARSNPSAPHSHQVQVAAPNFVLGDIDAVVLSSNVDADGARDPLPSSLEALVARVPGVQSVSGVIDTFAPLAQSSESSSPSTIPPRTPILFSVHNGDQLDVTSGRAPQAADEIVADADFLSREHVGVGDSVSLMLRGQILPLHIVGAFDLPGLDLNGVPLAAMSAAYQSPDLQLDRLDVNIKPGADPAKVRDAIAAATGSAYTVAPPSTISFPDQRLAQLEIQHAYWALLSPDPKERATSGNGPPSAQEKDNYQKYASLADSVELRVENVSFLSPDDATLTYRIFYDGSPSPIINEPQTGSATRVDGRWQLGKNTVCSLAALVGIKCSGDEHVNVAAPNGYAPASTLDPGLVHAFNVLADPDATVEQRIAVITDGAASRGVIEAGVEQDRSYAGKVTLTISGWRIDPAGDVDVLYSLQTVRGPSTPWPSIATVHKADDGHWYFTNQYACGIAGLAGGVCAEHTSSP